ncbi:MAG: 1-phosphofructokinase [Eubacterium sp.]
MIYTVTFNPALDYIMNVENLQTKDINRTQSEELYYGGKGINVSVILSRLGIPNKALGFLAGFSGRQLEAMLNEEKINNDFVYLENGYTRINVKIKAQDEIDINAQGPKIEKKDIEALLKKLDEMQDGDFIVLAGSIPKTLPDDIYERILQRLADKSINSVVDATGDLLLNVLKFKPFLIKPNHHELGDIFNIELRTQDEIVHYAKELQKMGARNVLVSCSKDGAMLIDESSKVHTMGNVPGKPVSSVGCGDSMVAGFLAGYTEKKDYYYALKLGSACGNATAFSSALAEKAQIMDMLNSEYLK